MARKQKANKRPSSKKERQLTRPAHKLPNVLKLFRMALYSLKTSWRLYGAIILVYGLLTVIFVRGFGSGLNLQDLKNSFQNVFNGSLGQLSTGVSLFGVLLGSAGTSSNPTASVYQSILVVVISLVLIWSLRQQQARHRVSLRDAFYNGLYPLIPFLLVLAIIGAQLLPLAAGSALYSLAVGNGIAVTIIEKSLWGLVFFLLALVSLYLVSSSIFALYIVTLPEMTPLRALRSARELVRGRRWIVLRKIVLLPILLLIAAAVIMIPLVILLTPVAEWVFFMCTMAALAIVHSYMYTLYRELL